MNLRRIIETRYFFSSLVLVLLMVSESIHGTWVVDFWEHCAVVREFSAHPFNPQHPLFLLDAPHPFFSPYLLVVGLFAKISSLDPITALTVAGICNLIFLLISLRLFIHRAFEKNQDVICFYALLFILFFWPSGGWNWSGFYHFKALGNVLPYPSMFATAATFLIFSLYYRALELKRINNYLILIVLTAIVILTHPTTAVFTLAGIVAISIHYHNNISLRSLGIGFLIILGAILLAFAWPYYSFLALIKTNNPEFHESSFTFYDSIYSRIYPVIFVLPILLYRLKNNKTDLLVLLFAGLILAYMFGYFNGNYGIGRIISFLAITVQLALAEFVARLEPAIKKRSLLGIIVLTLIFGFTISLNRHNSEAFSRAILGAENTYSEYSFLSEHTQPYDVILTDAVSSWMVPSFGGKVIASIHPIYWINDHEERRRDLQLFLHPQINSKIKTGIIKKYGANYILINKKRAGNPKAFLFYGEIEHENDTFMLIKIKES